MQDLKALVFSLISLHFKVGWLARLALSQLQRWTDGIDQTDLNNACVDASIYWNRSIDIVDAGQSVLAVLCKGMAVECC